MARAVLSLGANMEDPAGQLAHAVAALRETDGISEVIASTVIVTEPWGVTDQPQFHNMALAIETTLAPLDLLRACLAIEAELGRVRLRRWGPRVIDIDVIAYDRVVMETPELTLPHPYAHERDFVLVPVREIAPEVADWLVARRG